ncbi:MAG: HD domain-containing protein [Phycisphaerales bacterium]|nr:MAG: HD domain-containing protein [Phycisphaerales bacterium]
MGSAGLADLAGGWEDLPPGVRQIWALAEEDLTVQETDGPVDVFLWEHTKRVVASIPSVLRLLGEKAGETDRVALFVAGLYHDAGMAFQVRDGTLSRWDVLSRPGTDVQQELAAGRAEERLAGRISGNSLETAINVIRGLHSRDAQLPEIHVLADTDGLDQIGPLALWQTVRLNAFRGKGVQDSVDHWLSQQEYHFWEARLGRFRFAVMRKLAERRLEALDRFLRAVAALSRGEDLEA